MSVCTYVCAHVYVRMCACVSTRLFACKYTRSCPYARVCVHAFMLVCVRVCAHVPFFANALSFAFACVIELEQNAANLSPCVRMRACFRPYARVCVCASDGVPAVTDSCSVHRSQAISHKKDRSGSRDASSLHERLADVSRRPSLPQKPRFWSCAVCFRSVDPHVSREFLRAFHGLGFAAKREPGLGLLHADGHRGLAHGIQHRLFPGRPALHQLKRWVT